MSSQKELKAGLKVKFTSTARSMSGYGTIERVTDSTVVIITADNQRVFVSRDRDLYPHDRVKVVSELYLKNHKINPVTLRPVML